ncbi:iron chaperone [Stenotrophomonas humi]
MSKSDGFTAEERAAMKERARELKAEAKAGKLKAEGEADIMEKIGQMPPAEGKMARRLHEIITATAPALSPKTWYGMPAYANADGKVVVFFQGASKFGSRYSTLGFNDTAALDDGDMWPTVFALITLTPAVEKKVTALVKKAMR